MLDSSIHRLLEEHINSSTKLTIVMLYAGEKSLNATVPEVSRRLWSNIWSVGPALEELAADGVLVVEDGRYRLDPAPERRDTLRRLLALYDEPMHRQEIMHVVAELDRYAPYREMLNSQTVTVF